MKKTDKYAAIHYHDYLQLDAILSSQIPRSGLYENAAHEETLFIIIHQVYELWFKQILHEVGSVMNMFDKDHVDEKNIGIAVARIERVNEIMKLLIQQIQVLETMTPLDFLEFRNFLFPASGFQSFQFRKLEILLGLKIQQRFSYQSRPYYHEFDAKQQEEIQSMEQAKSLFDQIVQWLERTPFLQFDHFHFDVAYREAILKMIEAEKQAIIDSDYLDDDAKQARLVMIGANGEYFGTVLDPIKHQERLDAGEIRISYKSMMAAILIHLYRDAPILQLPYRLLESITTMDELFTTWRYRHAQMVMRMLGKKTGTGGSSGFDYLMETVKRHQIFKDFQHVSTLLIPRSYLPVLPEKLQQELGFYYSFKS